jgi:hypothetical protein
MTQHTNVSMLLYAHGQVLLKETEDDLQRVARSLFKVTSNCGMNISINSTMSMAVEAK